MTAYRFGDMGRETPADCPDCGVEMATNFTDDQWCPICEAKEDEVFNEGGRQPCVGCGYPFQLHDVAYGVTNDLGEHRVVHARCLPAIGSPTN